METTVTQTSKLDEHLDGLAAVRDFLAAHPDLPPVLSVYLSDVRLHLFPFDLADDADLREEFARCARILMAGAPIGSITKDTTDSFQQVTRKFGAVDLVVSADRAAVCERRVIGVEKVEVPDPAAPKVEVDREIVEWVCEPILSVSSEPASLAAQSAEVGK